MPSREDRILRKASCGAYFVAGFAIASWAPLVPYIKTRAGLEDGPLGLLMLCLGVGSVIMMPLTGLLVTRLGCRAVICLMALFMALSLPMLGYLTSPILLAVSLLIFGAAVGSLDVAACIQAVTVQKRYTRQIMPSIMAFYSIGNITGSAGGSALLTLGLTPLQTALACVVIAAFVLALCGPRLSHAAKNQGQQEKAIGIPRGPVLLLGMLCFAVFLSEGAIMDWSALFLSGYKNFETSAGGVGFAVFSVAIALGRFSGERLLRFAGSEKNLLIGGCIVSAVGLFLGGAVLPDSWSLAGLFIMGFGGSNVIPLFFAAAGKQGVMPHAAAIPAVTTMGYAGVLIGPAMLGGIAQITSLFTAFCFIGVVMLLAAAGSHWYVGMPKSGIR